MVEERGQQVSIEKLRSAGD